jgi:mRNA-degrading endonuclease toxin of MazEF toxin-antitoxin module
MQSAYDVRQSCPDLSNLSVGRQVGIQRRPSPRRPGRRRRWEGPSVASVWRARRDWPTVVHDPVSGIPPDLGASASVSVSSLSKDSVANVSQIFTVDRSQLTEPVWRLSDAKLELILYGIDVLGGK